MIEEKPECNPGLSGIALRRKETPQITLNEYKIR